MEIFDTPGEAWFFWWVALMAYLRHVRGKLHWRHRPSLHEEGGGYFVIARLVADKSKH